MYCKHCGNENIDEAVYCKSCGRRLEGEIFCTSCGKKLDCDSAFCIYCGQRVVNTQATPAVPAPVNAGACVQGGRQYNPEQAAAKTKKILNYIAAAGILAAVVFALIFVFFTGVVSSVNMSFSGSTGVKENTDIYYFFSDAYKDLSEILKDGHFTKFSSVYMYTPIVFGTITSAITLLVVVIPAIAAIVFSIKYLMGKSKSCGAGFALASYMGFVVGSLLLLAIGNSAISYDGISVSYKLNGATTAGLVLCSFAVATYVGCTIAARGKELAQGKNIVNLIFSSVAIVLIVVILAVASLPAYGIKTEDFGYGDKMSCGLGVLISALGIICTPQKNLKLASNNVAVYLLASTAILFLIAFVIVAAFLLIKSLNCATGKENEKAGLALSIVLSVLAVLFLVFSIIAAEQFLIAAEKIEGAEIMGEDTEEVKFTYAIPIVILILSLFSLGVHITKVCLNKKYSNPPAQNTRQAVIDPPVQNV